MSLHVGIGLALGLVTWAAPDGAQRLVFAIGFALVASYAGGPALALWGAMAVLAVAIFATVWEHTPTLQ